jgi:hypothetical protein
MPISQKYKIAILNSNPVQDYITQYVFDVIDGPFVYNARPNRLFYGLLLITTIVIGTIAIKLG